MGCSEILTVGIQVLPVDSVLIRLVDMGFNGMLSDFHSRYKGTTCDLNQIAQNSICP